MHANTKGSEVSGTGITPHIFFFFKKIKNHFSIFFSPQIISKLLLTIFIANIFLKSLNIFMWNKHNIIV